MNLEGRRFIIAALVAGFYVGAATDWWLRVKIAPELKPLAPLYQATAGTQPDKDPAAAATIGRPRSAAPVGRPPPPAPLTPTISSGLEGAVADLERRDLRLPIDGLNPESFRGSFSERRGGRSHEAADMLAPRGTLVHAVEDGTVAKLFYSRAGGNTVYQFDPSQRFTYYYAHLDGYAVGLKEGQRVTRGDVIGFVGTSGNAPPNTPHLHFGVFELTPERRWWEGRAIDPYLVFSR